MPKILIALLMLFVLPANAEAMHFSKDYKNEIIKQVKISWYGEAICRGRKFCKTASGQEFKWWEYSTACPSHYRFGTVFNIKYGENSVMVSCNDRGGFERLGRFLDLSSGAFEELAKLKRGILTVDVEVLNEKN